MHVCKSTYGYYKINGAGVPCALYALQSCGFWPLDDVCERLDLSFSELSFSVFCCAVVTVCLFEVCAAAPDVEEKPIAALPIGQQEQLVQVVEAEAGPEAYEEALYQQQLPVYAEAPPRRQYYSERRPSEGRHGVGVGGSVQQRARPMDGRVAGDWEYLRRLHAEKRLAAAGPWAQPKQTHERAHEMMTLSERRARGLLAQSEYAQKAREVAAQDYQVRALAPSCHS